MVLKLYQLYPKKLYVCSRYMHKCAINHEQAQSNRACTIFMFVVFGGFQSSLFIYFNITAALFVPCGGCKMSPRTFNQCCYQLRPLKVVEHDTYVLC
jgi:hypothetical protein